MGAVPLLKPKHCIGKCTDKMTRFELKQLVCNTLDVISYHIGLQYEGKNHASQPVMDMLDCYSDNKVLSPKEVDMVDEWLSTYEASHA